MSNFVVYEALVTEDQDINNIHPMAWKMTADSDMMYLHQVLKQPDQQQFLEAMDEEIKAHTNGKPWEIIPGSQEPTSLMNLPMVWTMKRK